MTVRAISFSQAKAFNKPQSLEDYILMTTATLQSELRDIADHIPESATYADVMYQLYVRMKIAKGKKAADEGRLIFHDEVKVRFAK